MAVDVDADPEVSMACAARLARIAEDVGTAAARVAGTSASGGASANGREALAAGLGRHAAELTAVVEEIRRAALAVLEQETAVLDELHVVEQRRLASGPSLITRVLG